MNPPGAVHTVGKTVAALARRMRAAGLAYGHGTFNANDEAAWLVLHACGLPLGELEDHADSPISPARWRRIERLVERRIRERIPAAYLTHQAWLGENSFYVDRRVIVPRSFIAELLPEGLRMFLRGRVRNALDLCTGSGCLAVLLARAFPGAHVEAADLSSGALAVAKRNVDQYDLARRVTLVRSDLFSALADRRYDLIVSNPPYVTAANMARLPHEYRAEPRMALAGGGDGLVLVRKILSQAKHHLKPGGVLVCEVGRNRKGMERAFPGLAFTWLDTSAGDGVVFLLEKEQLPA